MANHIVPRTAGELAALLDKELIVIGRPAQKAGRSDLAPVINTDADTFAARMAAIMEKKRAGYLLRLDEGLDAMGINPEDETEAWLDSYEFQRERVSDCFGGKR